MTERKRLVVHIISGLGDGGAEGVLFRLCTSDKAFRHIIITMTGGGKYHTKLVEAGYVVYCLDMTPGQPSVKGANLLYRILKQEKPFAVQTWMYHADFFGGLIARAAGCRNVIWNVRNSDPDCMRHSWFGRYLPKICAALSRYVPKKIVFCAEKAANNHFSIGYDATRSNIICNGYDLSRYVPRAVFKNQATKYLPYMAEGPVIGMVARFNPQKDHKNLFEAISILDSSGFSLNFVLIGHGMEPDSEAQKTLMHGRHLNKCQTYFLGVRENVPDFMNVFDIHVLSSRTEGFPNVLAEAMACGTPCVATDAGDARTIIGDTGWVVPPGSAQDLADGIREAVKSFYADRTAWQERAVKCRVRVKNYFSLESMVEKYAKVWCGGQG